MQTLALKIQDNFMQYFLASIEYYGNKVQLKKLKQDINDVDSG